MVILKKYLFAKNIQKLAMKPNVTLIISGRCYEDGVDSVGYDIKDFRVSSIWECQSECKKVANCKLFVFAPSLKNCWLKHTINTRTINSDRIVGPRVCTGLNFFQAFKSKF